VLSRYHPSRVSFNQWCWSVAPRRFSAYAGDITAWIKSLNAYWIGNTNGSKVRASARLPCLVAP